MIDDVDVTVSGDFDCDAADYGVTGADDGC